jgi:uncharacterized protein YodC (DUF2158 family)
MTFQVGDVVQLKSGGPKMTVDGYEDGLVVCVWFEKTDRKSSPFREATLMMYRAPGPIRVVRS